MILVRTNLLALSNFWTLSLGLSVLDSNDFGLYRPMRNLTIAAGAI